MELNEIINEFKNSSKKNFVGILTKLRYSKSLVDELCEQTAFLEEKYNDLTHQQRLYHVYNNVGIVNCSCGAPLKFTGRLSRYEAEENTTETHQVNYHRTCGSAACRINDIIRIYGSLESMINKIKKDTDLKNFVILKTSFLDSHYDNLSIEQRLYHIFSNSYELEKCLYCDDVKRFSATNKLSTGIDKHNQTNYYSTCGSDVCHKKHISATTKSAVFKKFGVENISQTQEWHDKIKKTNNKKYGCDYQTQSENFKEKTKKTWKKKYGFEHHTKSDHTKNKKIETVRERYGVDHVLQNPKTIEKIKSTSLERYGMDWYSKTDEFKEKYRKTMIEKYGVDCVMHHTPSFQNQFKKTAKWKKFVFPSGRIADIQGYEGFAINDLLNSGYDETDIITSNIEIEMFTDKIWYFDFENNKKRKYYPDIYIKSENKIIEVKSEYTFKTHKKINLLKKESCESLGLLFEFWIYNSDGVKIDYKIK